jgi:beta-1,4-mannooligosaccharide phosphorylase
MTPATRRDLFKLGGGAAAAAALAGGATTSATSAAPRASAALATTDLPVGYPLGPFVRDPANPILRATNRPWESRFVFNPAAIVKDGLVHLLYRAQGPDGRSSIGLGTSSDGVHFDRLKKPVMDATEPFELPGGCGGPARRRGRRHLLHDLHGLRRRQRSPGPRHVARPPTLDQAQSAVPGLRDPHGWQAVEQVRGDPHDAAGRPLLHVFRRCGQSEYRPGYSINVHSTEGGFPVVACGDIPTG